MQLLGEFAEQAVIERELIFGIVGAGVGVRDRKCNFQPLRSAWEAGEEPLPSLADCGVLSIGDVGADQLGVQLGSRSGGGKALVEHGEQLGGFFAMEVRSGLLLFIMELRSRVLRVEPERENAVEVAGPAVERGDVLIEREIAGAKLNG